MTALMQRLFGPVEVEQTGLWPGIEVGRALQRKVALNQAVAFRTMCCFVMITRHDCMRSVFLLKSSPMGVLTRLMSYFELHFQG